LFLQHVIYILYTKLFYILNIIIYGICQYVSRNYNFTNEIPPPINPTSAGGEEEEEEGWAMPSTELPVWVMYGVYL
jgi:hypothetical protein